MHDVIVIGGGVNGLVAGAMFAKQKLSTLILEQRSDVGGAATTSEISPGFHAPRLSHALGPLRNDVIRALRLDRGAGLEFITPDPSLTSLGRGQVLSLHPDVVLTAGSINGVSPSDAARWREFVQVTSRQSRLLDYFNRQAPPVFDEGTRGNLWQIWQLARRTRGLGPRELARLARWVPMSIADIVEEWFESGLVKAAIAAHAIFGNPVGPKSPGTGALWLQRLGSDPSPAGAGVTVRGGPGALAAALRKIALAAGAEVRTDARVARIAVTSRAARGVFLETGEDLPAHAVVSAVDPRQTLLKLVDPGDLTPTIRERATNYRARGVTAKVNLALSGSPAFTALHGDAVPMRGRLLIGPSLDYLEHAYDGIKYGDISAEPWLEISIPSMVDPGLAPDGCHVMSVNAHFVRGEAQSATGADLRGRVFQSVVNVLTQHAPSLQSLIVHRDVLTPPDLEEGWGLSGGHIFHGETTIDQSWMARPFLGCSRYRTPIDGLYLAGAGTHPGGGITGGSGFLAAKTIAKEIRDRRRRT